MAFEVLITDEAFADLDVIVAFIKRQASIAIARTPRHIAGHAAGGWTRRDRGLMFRV